MPPVTVMIKPVSGACNMRCQYCFYADEMKKRQTAVYPAMTEQTLEMTVRRTMAYADGQASFTFQGGEPTLAGTAFYERLLKLQREYNVRGVAVQNAIQTNGLDLSDDMIDLFARHHFLVGVSLDGCGETHDLFRRDVAGKGTFERVCQNIEKMQKAGVEFNILCVVNGAVAARADEVMNSLSAYAYLQFIPCMDELDGVAGAYSLTNEAYAHFLQTAFAVYERAHLRGEQLSIRQFDNWIGMLMGLTPESCAMRGVCTCGFLIESSGDVFPCDFYALDEWKLGNVNTHSFRQMQRNPLAHAFCEASVPVPEKCRECRWYPLCRNGCRRERNPDGQYRLCEGTKAFLGDHISQMKKVTRLFQQRNPHLPHGIMQI